MPRKIVVYECYRCGYTTKRKDCIRKHLFTLAKICRPHEHDIELTAEIKDTIMSKMKYRPVDNTQLQISTQKRETMCHQTINNYQVLQNIVVGMDPQEKTEYILDYTGEESIDYEKFLEIFFAGKLLRLGDLSFTSAYVMDESNLLDCVNKSTQIVGDISKFCIYYDKKINKIKINLGGQWESFIEDQGVVEIIKFIKSYFFNDYEVYLIKNLHDPTSKVNRPLLKEHLEIYYRFIAMFDLKPYIYDLNDEDILGHRLSDSTNIKLKLMYERVYNDKNNAVKTSDKDKIKNKLLKIIKGNTVQNIEELNKIIIDILKIDDTNRINLFQKYQLDYNE